MERKVTAEEAQEQFGRILKGVCKEGNDFIVEQDGEPVAAIVPYRIYQRWQAEIRWMFDRMRQAGEHANMDPDEAMALAVEVTREVRREMARQRERQR